MSKEKGIVIKSGRGWALIMRSDGAYQRIKTSQPLYPGQIYRSKPLPLFRYGVAAAVLLFFLVGAIDFFNVVAYASISPGIELGLNRWERVVAVKTDSEDAASIVARVDTTGRPAEKVVQDLVSEVLEQDLLPENSVGSLTISVHTKKAGQKHEAAYKQDLAAKINHSVDAALMTHDQVKIKDEIEQEQVKIHYQPASSGNKTGWTGDTPGKSDPAGKAWGHKKDSQDAPGNQNKIDNQRDKPNNKNSMNENKAPEAEQPAAKEDQDGAPISVKEKIINEWQETKEKLHLPNFHSQIKPGQEKKNKLQE